MSEIKTEIKQNLDGSYTITDVHSTADIVRWLLTQDTIETIVYLLGVSQPLQAPLSEAAIEGLAKFVAIDDFNYDFARAVEKAHGISK